MIICCRFQKLLGGISQFSSISRWNFPWKPSIQRAWAMENGRYESPLGDAVLRAQGSSLRDGLGPSENPGRGSRASDSVQLLKKSGWILWLVDIRCFFFELAENVFWFSCGLWTSKHNWGGPSCSYKCIKPTYPIGKSQGYDLLRILGMSRQVNHRIFGGFCSFPIFFWISMRIHLGQAWIMKVGGFVGQKCWLNFVYPTKNHGGCGET